jgi:hypothetical protein
MLSADEILTLPVTLQPDRSGLELVPLDHEGRYRFTLRYLTEQATTPDAGSRVKMLVPLPPANEGQVVTITETSGIIPSTIKRDRLGNSVLISTDMSSDSLPDAITVHCTVETRSFRQVIPKKYSYNASINPWVETSLNSYKIRLNTTYRAPGLVTTNQEPGFETLIAWVTAYKEDVNNSKVRRDRIYDRKVTDLYPIPARAYLERAMEFLTFCSKKGIPGRIVHGWLFPRQTDIFTPGFLVEIFIPGKGLMILDKSLDLYTSSGTFISWHTDLPLEPENSEHGYLGLVDQNGRTRFIDTVVEISGGEMNSDGTIPDPRYLKRVAVQPLRQEKSIAVGEIINFDSFYDSTDDSFLVFSRDETRNYQVSPTWKYMEDIVLCSSFTKGKAGGIKEVYGRKEEVYAVFYFKERKTEKKTHYLWIKPDGTKKWDKKLVINGSWRYYYTILNYKRKATMEAGRWCIEVYINGVLDGRREFSIR